MIEITAARGTDEWRRAHRKHIDASEAPLFMAKAGTKRRHELVERLVLDFEGIGDHRDEQPDPWDEMHERDVVIAIAAYKRETGLVDVRVPGLIQSSYLSWLVCSPHGLSDDGCMITRTKRTAKSFHATRGIVRISDRARAQLTAFACERAWCDLVDVWVPGFGLPDRLAITREDANHTWVIENVLPRLTTVWRDVAERLQARRAPRPA